APEQRLVRPAAARGEHPDGSDQDCTGDQHGNQCRHQPSPPPAHNAQCARSRLHPAATSMVSGSSRACMPARRLGLDGVVSSRPLLMALSAVECLPLGGGIVFLVFGWPCIRRLTPDAPAQFALITPAW